MAADDRLNGENCNVMLDMSMDVPQSTTNNNNNNNNNNDNGEQQQQEQSRQQPAVESTARSRSRSRSRSRGNNNRSRSPRGGGGGGGGANKPGSRSPRRSPARNRRRKRSGSPRSKNDKNNNNRMVFITNIPYDVRWMEIKDMIREKAGEVSYVEMIEKDGRSKGCAVVEFKTRESTEKCLGTMHRLEVGDRRLVVKEIRDPELFFTRIREEYDIDFMANRSAPSRNYVSSGGGGSGGKRRDGRSSSSATTPFGFDTYGLSPVFLSQLGIEGPLCNRVFVANLPYSVSTSAIREVFSLAGQVIDVDLQLDKEGKNKGLAVVEYTHPIEAVQAISMLNTQEFMERALTVKMDKFTKQIEPRRPGELPFGLRRVGMGLGANGSPLTNIAQLVAAGSIGGSSLSSSRNVPNVSPFGGDFYGGGGHSGGGSVRLEDSPGGRVYLSGGGGASGPSLSSSRLSSGGGGSFAAPFGGSMSGGGGIAPFSGGGLASDYFRDKERDREREYRSLDRDLLDVPRIGGGSGGGSGGYGSSLVGGGGSSAAAAFYDSYPVSGGRPSSPYGSSRLGYGDGLSVGGGGISGGSIVASPGDGYGSRAAAAPVVAAADYDPAYRRKRSPSPQAQLQRSAPRHLRAILIRNLPLDYSWQTLRDRMRGFGEVEYADIIQPGVGKVRFNLASDAEKACVSLHGMHVEGRPITVDLVNSD